MCRAGSVDLAALLRRVQQKPALITRKEQCECESVLVWHAGVEKVETLLRFVRKGTAERGVIRWAAREVFHAIYVLDDMEPALLSAPRTALAVLIGMLPDAERALLLYDCCGILGVEPDSPPPID